MCRFGNSPRNDSIGKPGNILHTRTILKPIGEFPQMLYLLILPVAYVICLLIMQATATPYWLWTNIDPSYFYLLNGLEMALGQAPADFHHPGTTTQLIAGLVMRLAHPLLSSDHLIDTVLSDPERSLLLIARVDDGLIALSMLWAGFEARRLFQGLTVPALLIQATPFLSTVMLINAYPVKPEATLVMAGSILSALMCRMMAQPGSKIAAGLGAVVGFAMVTKIHALTLFAVPVFLLRGRDRLIYAAAAGLAVLVFAAPIFGKLGDMHRWFMGMATHNGPYGAGEAGLLPDHYGINLLKQLRRPIFSLPLVLGLFTLWKRRGAFTPTELPMARALAGVLLAQVFHLLLVAKNPLSYYQIPAFLTMGLSAALALTLLRPSLSIAETTWRKGLAVIAVALVVTQSLSISDAIHNRTREKKTSQAMDMSAFAACTKVNFDFASDRTFALMLGNWMADWRFKPWLSTHLPADTLMWVPANGLPQQWDETQIPWPEVVARSSCTVLRGAWGKAARAEMAEKLPGVPFNACTNGDEWVLSTGIDCGSAFPGIDSTPKS